MKTLTSLISLAVLAGTLSAQVAGSLSGKVEDATGGALPGVTVTVKHVETGASRNATTDSNGQYRLQAIPIGALEVRAEKAGFKTTVRSGVQLDVAQELVRKPPPGLRKPQWSTPQLPT